MRKGFKYERSAQIIEFLDEIYNEFSFEILQTDGGKELDNSLMRKWIESNTIRHDKTTPYYHAANGRIERAERTMRRAINRLKGPLRNKLKRALQSYNNCINRGIDTTPQ